jgi:hypothetical protein
MPFALNRTPRSVHLLTTFHALLAQERRVCDQSSLGFCLVTFDWPAPADTTAARGSLAQALTAVIRKTDEAGWLTETRLAVLMRCSESKAAWAFCKRLREAHPEYAPAICRVYIYAPPRGHRGATAPFGARLAAHTDLADVSIPESRACLSDLQPVEPPDASP